MIPTTFPQANGNHGAPKDVNEDNVRRMPSFTGNIQGGPFDGSQMVIVAWKPTLADLVNLNNGGCVFVSVIGQLSPHYVSSTFEEAATL